MEARIRLPEQSLLMVQAMALQAEEPVAALRSGWQPPALS